MASYGPRELGDAVGCGPVAGLALLRQHGGHQRTKRSDGGHAHIDREAPAESYYDLSANWAVTEKSSVVLGINNVLDDNPSLSGTVGTTGNGNTFPQIYDALGRYVFLRATVTF